MQERRIKCPDVGAGASGFHDMAYGEWGDPSNDRVVVCVHGLTRNGRDFDVLATALQDDYRVVCPDVAGRGKSDWLTDPMQYGPVQYAADMTALVAQLGVAQVDWIGTSMGGVIGMVMAAKMGMNQYVRGLSLDLAEFGIRANQVVVGTYDTVRDSSTAAPRRADQIATVPLGREGVPQDLANLIRYLVGPGGDYITGQTIHSNGGAFMNF